MNSSALQPRDRIIVALDYPTQAKALAVVSALGSSVSTYKIGLQLYTAAGELGVAMLTAPLAGGGASLKAEAEAKPPHLALLGVTVLTSATDETLAETGVGGSVTDQVVRLAALGEKAGVNGFITSPKEVGLLRNRFDRNMMLVTPGVRPAWAGADDQKRFTTPADAVANGADYLVIGRPITAAEDPPAAVERIVDEMTT